MFRRMLSPVAWFKPSDESSVCGMQSGQMDPIDLLVETSFHRAAPGGMGATKCAGALLPLSDVDCCPLLPNSLT